MGCREWWPPDDVIGGVGVETIAVPRHSTDNLKRTALGWTFLLDDDKYLGARHMEGVAYN